MSNSPHSSSPSVEYSGRKPGPSLRDIIRRGQRRDRLFSYAGAALIVLSLGVLVVLLVKLVVDGGPMLVHKQEVLKSTGLAPKIVPVPDVVGTVKQLPDAEGKPAWQVTPRAIKVELNRFGTSREKPLTPAEADAEARKVLGQRVVLESVTITDPAGGHIEPEEIKLAPLSDSAYAATAKISRKHSIGVIRDEFDVLEGKKVLKFYQDPMWLDLSKVENAAQLADGMSVAVSPARELRKVIGTVSVREIDQIEKKSFFFSMPASAWYRAGVFSGWVGSLLVVFVTIGATLPLGIAAGVYLEEYAAKNRFTSMIEVNIANLAGVPSVVWGLLGLGLFVYGIQLPEMFHLHLGEVPVIGPIAKWIDWDGNGSFTHILGFGPSILSAGLTLALLVLPIIVIATREAIRAIPSTIRDASIALGATKWQTVWNHVIPYSLGGILTGSIVAVSRALGETAPLIVVGAAVYLTSLPPKPIDTRPVGSASASTEAAAASSSGQSAAATQPAATGETETVFQPGAWLKSDFTAMPIQMFEWTSRPEKEFQRNAAAAGVILIVMTLTLNSVAIWLRARLRKRIKW
jgi:phosphate transport system permease protein